MAGTLVVAWAEVGPEADVAMGRKAAHIKARLNQDLLSAPAAQAGDPHHLLDRDLERAHAFLDLEAQLGDLPVEELDVLQLVAKQIPLVVTHRPLEGLF